jgi:hypothetical protein
MTHTCGTPAVGRVLDALAKEDQKRKLETLGHLY